MKKIDKNDPFFIPYIEGYGALFYYDWMDIDRGPPFEGSRIITGNLHVIKDFIPVSQMRWYDENKLLYRYESPKC